MNVDLFYAASTALVISFAYLYQMIINVELKLIKNERNDDKKKKN